MRKWRGWWRLFSCSSSLQEQDFRGFKGGLWCGGREEMWWSRVFVSILSKIEMNTLRLAIWRIWPNTDKKRLCRELQGRLLHASLLRFHLFRIISQWVVAAIILVQGPHNYSCPNARTMIVSDQSYLIVPYPCLIIPYLQASLRSLPLLRSSTSTSGRCSSGKDAKGPQPGYELPYLLDTVAFHTPWLP